MYRLGKGFDDGQPDGPEVRGVALAQQPDAADILGRSEVDGKAGQVAVAEEREHLGKADHRFVHAIAQRHTDQL